MADDRRYDDREVGLILKRVAELHERQGEKSDARAMSKTEIEEVVAELGISKSLVSRAVSDIAIRDIRNRPVWWLGGKTDLMFEDVINGHVDDETLVQMIEVLRRHFGDPGDLQTDGATRIWSTTSNTTRRIHFTVVQHRDTTTLRLEERMPTDARTTVGLATFAVGFSAFLTIIPLKVLVLKTILLLSLGPLVATGTLLGWLLGRTLWSRRSQSRETQLHQAFEKILALPAPKPDPR